MHDGLDPVLGQHLIDRGRVARVAQDQRRAQHGAAIAGREVIEDHDALAALDELADDVAADVPGATGDENRLRHGWDGSSTPVGSL